MLIVVDVLSKYAVPLKSKGGSDTADTIAEIIRANGRCPKNLQTDMRKEFYNSDVQKSLKTRINHYSTHLTLKASVVVQFNRTLKNDLWKIFTLNGNYKWVNELPRLVSDYNARKYCSAVPIIYLLEDYRGKFAAGAFYEHELHRAIHPDVYLMEKGYKMYVKWLGFDESHNLWIHKNNVI